MRGTNYAAMAIGLTVMGWIFSPDANAQWGWSNWWPPHEVQESIRTDTFTGQIAAITNSTMTVRGNEVIKHRVYWSYAYTATETSPTTSTSSADSHEKEQSSDQEQTFRIAPSCRVFAANGDRTLVAKLPVGGMVTVSYAVQTKGEWVADEITVNNLKP